MSYREDRIKSLAGLNLDNKTSKGLNNLFKRVLKGGMHGLCFSPYEEGQEPGEQITEKQIRRRMKIIKPYTKWIRSFSCTDGNEAIPRIAKEFGIKTLVGAWLGDDAEINKKEGKDYDGWVFICSSKKSGDEHYYQTFKKNYVWLKTVFKKSKRGLVEKRTAKGSMVLYKFDCDAKEIGIKSSGYLTKDGVVGINKQVFAKMEIPFPNTMQLFFLNYFCYNIKNK